MDTVAATVDGPDGTYQVPVDVIDPAEAVEAVRLVTELMPAYLAEQRRLDLIDKWARWEQPMPDVTPKAKREHRALAELSRTPWFGLVLSSVAQALCVDGFRSPDSRQSSSAWRIWQANQMDARQAALHRAALTYGWCYEVVLPGDPVPVMRGVSPRGMFAVYDRPESDAWPLYALEVRGAKVTLFDDRFVWELSQSLDADNGWQVDRRTAHGVDVCPVVRFTNQIDLEGRCTGEIEPFIDVARRIDKTAYDRLLVQHFNSWKVRYAIGIDLEASGEDDPEAAKMRLSQSDMLVGKDPTARFGTLDETAPDGFIAAYRNDVEVLAAASQTPAYALTGTLVNLSADAIAAARAPLEQKIAERKTTFGESHAQALRLAALMSGDPAAAADFSSRITWQDMEVRSLSAAVDALGKAVTMLGVPASAMWERLPGVTQADVEEWRTAKLTEPATDSSDATPTDPAAGTTSATGAPAAP